MILNFIDKHDEIFVLDNEYILQPLEHYIIRCIEGGYYSMKIKIKGLNINFLIEYLKASLNTEEVQTLMKRFPITIFFDLTDYATSKKSAFRKSLDLKAILKIIEFTKSISLLSGDKIETKNIYHIIVNEEIQNHIECDQSSEGSE